MKRKLLTTTIHVAAWACFFLLPVVFFPGTRYSDEHMSDAMLQRFICLDAYLVGFYYLNTQLLIPQLLTKRKWIRYTLTIIACFILFATISKLFENAIQSELPENIRLQIRKRHRSFLYPFTGSSAVFFLFLQSARVRGSYRNG